ncbi:TonB-dependent receptor [Sediminicola luteus]|uniref:Collagen-binding protein n=1 Tax=Sediminicola luteus TaxID=319238 RepID=A0A2A4G5I6_9FLAO|nr:TonB-dependent receptor [Sediminicola luteus]PCE64229.1 collagen-binding protein [Sediminicola luteus]
MKKQLLLLFLLPILLQAQDKFSLSGSLKDQSNGETIFGANVFFEGTNIGAVTNEYGFFSLTAPQGEYTLVVSYMGYTDIKQTVSLNANQKLNLEMAPEASQLEEVVVVADETTKTNIKTPQMSTVQLKAETIKQMPVVLGEVDILKSIQMLPGVTNNGEGSSGFHVRGGASDQNLVLLDEAIIYNTSHLFGFFSVFNADAIKDMKLYKGGIPSQFGGRVSSVLDVRQKDGNSKEFKLTGGVGLVASRLAAEAPLFNGKGSFLLAGRGSYAHLFLNENKANFYDVNLKTNYEINENNRLYLSGYYGRDGMEFGSSFENDYGNLSGNLRWNHIFSERLFSNLSLIYSKYDYHFVFDDIGLDWVSDIDNYNLKYDLKWYMNDKIKFDFGASTIKYDFNPGEVTPTGEDSSVNYRKLDDKEALESAIYLGMEHKISPKFTAQYGMRYSHFIRQGPQSPNTYENDQPVVYNAEQGVYERGTPNGTKEYGSGDNIKTFGNFEPRLALSYQLDEKSSVKASYNRIAQYLHLISNTTSATPLDVWAPSGEFIDPQLGDQYAIGYFRNFANNAFSMEIEAYYKTIDNRLDYIDGADLIANNTIETEVLAGETRSYGLELLLKKNTGRLTGWLAYTLSKAEQRTPGGSAGGPGINNGDWYRTSYDRTHDLSLTASYQWNKKWSFGANFAFQTGRPITYPNGQFVYEGTSVATFSDRNADRLPAYHRLDLSATYRPNRKPNNRWKGEWVFGIYNVYNRHNAASISFGQNEDTGLNEASKTYIFGILPAISYNFKF